MSADKNVTTQELHDDLAQLSDTVLRIKRERDQAIALLREVQSALNSILDSFGALSNPSELDGMGLTDYEQTAILTANYRAQLFLKELES